MCRLHNGFAEKLVCLQLMQTAFTLWKFSPYSKKLIWGMMLLIIMLINMIQARMSRNAKIREMKLKSEGNEG